MKINKNTLNTLAKVFFWHTSITTLGVCAGVPGVGFMLAVINYPWIFLKLFFILQFLGSCCGLLAWVFIWFILYLEHGRDLNEFSKYYIKELTDDIIYKSSLFWIIWSFFSSLTLHFYTQDEPIYCLPFNFLITLYASLAPYLFFTHFEADEDYDGDDWLVVTDTSLILVKIHSFFFVISYIIILFIDIDVINKFYENYFYIF